MEQMNNNKSLNNQKKSEKSIFASNFQKIFNRKKINNQLNSNEKNNSIESNYRSNNSARNISIAYNNNSISINKNLSRERSCINISSRRNYLSKNLDIIPDHFPNRKLSKTEDENLNKILKAVIYYYCFNKFFMYFS
jgi:3-isopropylmalate dehydratase small subunit